MTSPALIEQLDTAINAMLARGDRAMPAVDPAILPLLGVAAELRSLPRQAFKTRLRTELMDRAAAPAVRVLEMPRPETRIATQAQVLPTLFGAGYGSYAVQRRNFALSFAAHAALVAFLATSGYWFAQHQQEIRKEMVTLIAPEISDYTPLSAKANDRIGGGGGGGDRDKMNAPKGQLPKFAMTQITPPAMVIRSVNPKLAVEPTVVVPPQVQIAHSILPNLGDPHSNLAGPPSNGLGSGGGIGSGNGGGIGSGEGPGVGPGRGGGMGGGVYRVGGGVSAPRAIYSPDPQYSEEARKAKYQGTVVLWLIVGPDGHPRDIKLARTLGMGLDEKAIEAVRQWKFAPAMKDGHPVAVQINVEVNFRLY
ncbi:MAG: energy transducer TonB [Terriglobales bacterium]